jgi:hypothetical protein
MTIDKTINAGKPHAAGVQVEPIVRLDLPRYLPSINSLKNKVVMVVVFAFLN